MRAKTTVRSAASWTLALMVGLGCSDLTEPDGLSDAQANAFSEQVSRAMNNAMNSTGYASADAGGVALPFVVNVQVDHTTNCTAGGNIHVTGSLTGNISDQGTGTLLLGLTETISDWKCIGDYVFNGDPYISATGTFPFINGAQSSAATVTIGGGFKWGTASAQSCAMQLSVVLQPNGTGTISGYVCNRQISGTL